MGDENKELVRRLEEAWNRSDVDRVRELLAPDFVSHSVAPGMPATVDAIVQAHQMSMQSFPDRKVAIEDILAEGDKVVVRCRTTGTNKGGLPWAGVPANDKPIDFSWISKYRIKGGKVAEHWGLNDTGTLMAQLGAMPGM